MPAIVRVIQKEISLVLWSIQRTESGNQQRALFWWRWWWAQGWYIYILILEYLNNATYTHHVDLYGRLSYVWYSFSNPLSVMFEIRIIPPDEPSRLMAKDTALMQKAFAY